MNRLLIILFTLVASHAVSPLVNAGPQEDLAAYQKYFKEKFSNLSSVDLSNGMYNFNNDKREQWEDIMSFPPYEIAIDDGKTLFTTPFKNNKTYSSCFENEGIAIAHTYPRFDLQRGKVVTWQRHSMSAERTMVKNHCHT